MSISMVRSLCDLLRHLPTGVIRLVALVAPLAGAHAAETPAFPPDPTIRAATEQVAVRAGLHPGFGRLVFEWEAPIEFERQESEGGLKLRFARPMRVDLEPARRRLGEYLAGIGQDETGRSVELRLAPDVSVVIASFQPDLVVLDFSRIEDVRERVTFRTGEHAGFTRVVFEWPRPVVFRANRQDQRLTIGFDRGEKIDVVKLRRRLDALLEEADVTDRDSGAELTLLLKPAVEAQIRRLGEAQVVLDLLHADTAPAVHAERPGGIATQATGALAAKPTPPPTMADAAVAGDRSAGSLSSAPAAAGSDTSAAGSATGAPGAVVLGELSFPWSRPVAAAVFVRAGWLWAAFDAPPDAATTAMPPPVGEALLAQLAPGELVESTDGTVVRFPMRQGIAVQVAREGDVWRVLALEHAVPPEPLPAERVGAPPRIRFEAGGSGRPIEVIDPEVGDRIGIWPVGTPERGQPHGRRLVDVDLLPTSQGVAWRARNDGVRARAVEAGIELGAGDGLLLSDRALEGDDRAGVVRELAQSEVETPQPEPSVPAAAAAAARSGSAAQRQPHPDDSIEAAEVGQAPPPVAPEIAPAERAAAPDRSAGASALALDTWTLGAGEPLPARRYALMEQLQGASAEGRTQAELNLARFFLAQAMAAETLAVLGGMGEDDETGAGPIAIAKQGLTGAAQLLMGRLGAAAAALMQPALDHDPEVAIWRAALAAGENDWARAAQELDRSEQTLERYPPVLQLRLGLPAALIALEVGNQDLAFAILARLRALEMEETDRGRVAFVEGLAHARAGAIDRADRIWQALESGPDEETRAKAAYARVIMLLERGRIDPDEALTELAPARADWRGHAWEPVMLGGTARVQVAANDVAGAIQTWRDLLGRHPTAPGTEQIAADMRKAFADAMLAENGADLPPLRAFALYRAHPELVPSGDEGDRMRRQLAGRLGALDLIEPAALLLGELVRHRLHGAEKAEAGAELAELWLRASQPEAAFAALVQSGVADELTPAIESRRILLRARALAALDRSGEALALIAGREDVPAQRLRIDLLWQQRDWPSLIPAIKRQLPAAGAPATALSDQEQRLVLKLAIAHSRLGRDAELRHMRARFGPAMRGRAAEAAFLVATMTEPRAREPEVVLAATIDGMDDVRRLLERK